MKTLNIPKEHFIGSYFIDEKVCDDMLDFFWSNKHKHSHSKLSYDIKKCIEFGINPNDKSELNLSYLNEIKNCVLKYGQEYEHDWTLGINEKYNIQHYNKGDGFYKWHSERTEKKFADRVLVFMTYLNDVNDGGTEFKFQNIEIKARKGLTLIWPSEWTHTHRGVISNTKEKTIVTGWFHLKNE